MSIVTVYASKRAAWNLIKTESEELSNLLTQISTRFGVAGMKTSINGKVIWDDLKTSQSNHEKEMSEGRHWSQMRRYKR